MSNVEPGFRVLDTAEVVVLGAEAVPVQVTDGMTVQQAIAAAVSANSIVAPDMGTSSIVRNAEPGNLSDLVKPGDVVSVVANAGNG